MAGKALTARPSEHRRGRTANRWPVCCGRVVLDNERVLVQAFGFQPGQSTGHHTHHDAEVLVFAKDGILKSESDGRATLWQDGRVVWLSPSTSADKGSRNAGDAPIELMEVILNLHQRQSVPK